MMRFSPTGRRSPKCGGRTRALAVAVAAGLAGAAASAHTDSEPDRPWARVDITDDADAVEAWSMVRGYFGNLRQGHPHETWISDEGAMPPARTIPECMAALAEHGLEFPRTDGHCRMSAQVRVEGPVEGVTFVSNRGEAPGAVELGCEMALRLPDVARVLHELGVTSVIVGPPARASKRSYHRFGLALDIYEFVLADGRTLVVDADYQPTPDRATCEGDPPEEDRARILRDISCRLFDARILSTVITPNYNAGHRNHFHVDVRPGDERFYLR